MQSFIFEFWLKLFFFNAPEQCVQLKKCVKCRLIFNSLHLESRLGITFKTTGCASVVSVICACAATLGKSCKPHLYGYIPRCKRGLSNVVYKWERVKG